MPERFGNIIKPMVWKGKFILGRKFGSIEDQILAPIAKRGKN